MSNHRTVLKPKDVKFKRINKAKARSLEELRDKLKWEQMLESVSAEEVVSGPFFESPDSGGTKSSPDYSGSKSSPSSNRLAMIRGFMERSASFDHDSLAGDSSVA
jgi:hypothetical protein